VHHRGHYPGILLRFYNRLQRCDQIKECRRHSREPLCFPNGLACLCPARRAPALSHGYSLFLSEAMTSERMGVKGHEKSFAARHGCTGMRALWGVIVMDISLAFRQHG
jgi:hypothetical protein